jgi:hypothetical protein
MCTAYKTHVGRAYQLSPAMKVTPISELADRHTLRVYISCEGNA